MKTILGYIWQRRWCKLLLAGLILCALPLLHPYIRQTTFGPTMNGTPWCVWEQNVRHAADSDEGNPNWFAKALEKLGIRRQPLEKVPAASPTFVPLYVSLATDSNVKVRRFALVELARGVGQSETEIVPALKQSLKDADPECRLSAARGIWRANKDPEVKEVLLALTDHNEALSVRQDAVHYLRDIAEESPELFGAMAKLAEDPIWMIRAEAIGSMGHFGMRGAPIIRKALHDPEWPVRSGAMDAAFTLEKDAIELVPDLVAMQKSEPNMQRHIAFGLHMIDPKRFSKPMTKTD